MYRFGTRCELLPKNYTLNFTPRDLPDPGVWTQPIFTQKKIPQNKIGDTIALSEIGNKERPEFIVIHG